MGVSPPPDRSLDATLRAPITTDLSAWHAPAGLWIVGVIAALGLGACYITRHGEGRAVTP